MSPSKVARELRRIAAAIDRSSAPDRTQVAQGLRRILAGAWGSDYLFFDEVTDTAFFTNDVWDGLEAMFDARHSRLKIVNWTDENDDQVNITIRDVVTLSRVYVNWVRTTDSDLDVLNTYFDGITVHKLDLEEEGDMGSIIVPSDDGVKVYPWPEVLSWYETTPLEGQHVKWYDSKSGGSVHGQTIDFDREKEEFGD